MRTIGPMLAATYELLERADGTKAFKCLFCKVESADTGSVERLYCANCGWFHEPLDPDSADLSRHLYAAVQEVRCALDLAEAAGEDLETVDRLKAALRELRKALSRA